MSEAEDITALLLAHEDAVPAMLRQIIQTVRGVVEVQYPEVTSREQLLVGAALLRMILVSIERTAL